MIADVYCAESDGETLIFDIAVGKSLVLELFGRYDSRRRRYLARVLAVARKQKVYRELIKGNLPEPLAPPDGVYGGATFCGTSTHVPVGPIFLL